MNIELLKHYIVIKLQLGIKSEELKKHLDNLIYEKGNINIGYETLADEIIYNNKNSLNKFYSRLRFNKNSSDDEKHQTLAKLLADFNNKQIDFLLTKDKKVNILCGSVRSGKTWIACFKFGIKVMNSPMNYSYMMAGSTLKSLEANTFKYFKLFFGKHFTYSLTQKSAILFGHKIRLEGAPTEIAYKKITGDTLAGVFIDEIQLIPESFVKQAYTRCSMGDSFLYGTCNPQGKNHWLYKEWISNPNMQNEVVMWTFLVQDNKFLSQEYIDSLYILFTGVFFQRNVLGMWVAAQGGVFTTFTDNHKKYISSINTKDEIQNICKSVEFCSIGVDFGGNKSGSTIVFTGFYRDINKGFIVLKSDKLIDDKGTIDSVRLCKFIISNIVQFKNKYKIPIICLSADCAEQYLIVDVRNALRKQGLNIPVEDSLKLRIMERVQFVSKMLAIEKINIVDNDANTLINCLDELVYNDKVLKDELLDDGSTDNDTWDAFSYSFEKLIKRFSYL